MDELILNAICEARQRGEKIALATIIVTKGSTPRKAGAAMLIWPDGRVVGTIGGGCSEAEVKMKALQVLADGLPCIYEVRMLNDIAAQEGMVCGGVMEVFIQIVTTE
jgi:xanthine dehydrogenase accessory factor